MFHHRYLSFMAFLLVMILALSACVPIQAPETGGEETPERGAVESAFTVGQAVAVTEEGNDPKIWRYGTIIQVEGDGVAVQFFVDGNERWMPGQTSTHPAHDGWVMSLAEAASQGIEIVNGANDAADGAYTVGQTVAVTEEGNDPKIWRYGTIVLVEGDGVAVGFFVDENQRWMPGQTSTHPAHDGWVMSLAAAAAQGIEIVDGTSTTADDATASTDTAADEEVPERGAVESAYTVGQAVAVTEEGNDPKIWRYGTIILVDGDEVAVEFFVDGTEEWMPGQTSTHPAHDGWVMSLAEAASQGIEIVNGTGDAADGAYTVGQTVAVTEEGNDPKIWRYGTIILVEGDAVAVEFFVDGTQEWMPGQTSTHPAHDGWVMSLEEAAAQGIEIVDGTSTTADDATASVDTAADEDDGPPERGTASTANLSFAPGDEIYIQVDGKWYLGTYTEHDADGNYVVEYMEGTTQWTIYTPYATDILTAADAQSQNIVAANTASDGTDSTAALPFAPGDEVYIQVDGKWYLGTYTEHNADGNYVVEYMEGTTQWTIYTPYATDILTAADAQSQNIVAANTASDGADSSTTSSDNADSSTASSDGADSSNGDSAAGGSNAAGACLSAEEKKLADAINAYRAENGLLAVKVTKSLTYVAQQHVADQNNHPGYPHSAFDADAEWKPPTADAFCNMHSWSKNAAGTQGCYTGDHRAQTVMWNKPQELAGFNSHGYEISHGASGVNVSAQSALDGWKSSGGHNDVILQNGIWNNNGNAWPSMGIGLKDGFANVWFAEAADPLGEAPACN